MSIIGPLSKILAVKELVVGFGSLGLKEVLIECATVYIKSEVILKNVYLTPKSKACNTLGVRRSKKSYCLPT